MTSSAIANQISEQTDLVALISRYVGLKQRGDTYWGCCPFHNEKTPSFTVNPARNAFYCFGCQEGGYAIQFLMKIEHISYGEALKELAKPLGIQLDEGYDKGEYEEQQKEKNALLELYLKVTELYRYMLFNSADGEIALNYITGRGLNEETLKTFSLGYSPSDGRWLYQFLIKKNYSPKILAGSGLFSKNKTDFHLFAGRLIFPVFNPEGKAIAFSGRKLPGDHSDMGKYINSPDTLIYSKKNHLYGLFQAKPSFKETKSFILSEGAMDVCALHQSGLKNAVASLGTGFTTEQARLLKRFVQKGSLFLDSDEAGRKATYRSALICETEEIETFVVKLDSGKDAAEIVEKKEERVLIKAVENATITFDFLLVNAINADKGSALGKNSAQQVVLALLPYLDAVKSPVRKESYFKALSYKLEISLDALKGEYDQFIKKGGRRELREELATKPEEKRVISPKKTVKANKASYSLVTALLALPQLYKQYKERIKEEFFDKEDETLQQLVSFISQNEGMANIFTLIESNLIDEELKDYFLKQLAADNEVGWEERANRALRLLEKQSLINERDKLDSQMREAQELGDDPSLLKHLIKRRLQVVKELKNILTF